MASAVRADNTILLGIIECFVIQANRNVMLIKKRVRFFRSPLFWKSWDLFILIIFCWLSYDMHLNFAYISNTNEFKISDYNDLILFSIRLS